jgi:hypothetical protein
MAEPREAGVPAASPGASATNAYRQKLRMALQDRAKPSRAASDDPPAANGNEQSPARTGVGVAVEGSLLSRQMSQDGGGGGGGGQSDTSRQTEILAGADDAALDVAAADSGTLEMGMLADRLAPLTGTSGIFEVIMPDGQQIGVAVDAQPDSVRLHLSWNNDKSAERMRRRQMELQGSLERRIRKKVDVTVL